MRRVLLLYLALFACGGGQAQTYPSPTFSNLPGSPLVGRTFNIGSNVCAAVTQTSDWENGGCQQGAFLSGISGSENYGEYGAFDWYFNFTNFSNTYASSLVSGLRITATAKAGSNSGSFSGLETQALLAGSQSTPNVGITSATFIAQSSTNDGGSPGSGLGVVFGINPNVRLISGATYYHQLVGEEIDITAYSGSSLDQKIGQQIVQLGPDAVVAGNFAAALSMNNASGTTGWPIGISFGSYDGYWPMAASGSMIGCYPHANTGSCGTVAYGLNLTNITFTTAAIASPGFTVDGSGNATTNSTKVATLAVASLPTCNSGTQGTRYYVNNATQTLTAGIGAVVAGGGANTVPVGCDGTNWRIGG